MRKLEGVIPVLLTPLTKDGEIDEPALGRLVEYLNTKNIGGFWVLGTGAEDMNLTYRQRLRVVETVVEANAGKSPLVVGAGFFAMRDSLDFMNDTAHLDFDAYHVMPYHTLLSLERIEWQYKKLADHAQKPLWMYTSANWCRFIPPEFVAKMKGYPNIAGVKFSTSNAVHTEKVIGMADENFQVLTAVVRTLYASLCLGVKGGTTVEACPFVNPIVDIYEKFKAGDMNAALAAQRKLNRFLEKMPEAPGKDNFLKVAEGKYILSKKGICDQYMSGYYRELTAEEKKQIDDLINSNPWISD
ncbi:MAG: dihydrodipicolinate synthase family protein [Betaproteobacteria bacterium]|nr:dihydrodipicolinate synthase family protein [Betaproteobacteria bacterium]